MSKMAAPIGEATRTPAPGAYNPSGDRIKASRFGSVDREVDFKIKKTPGPSAYDIKGLMGNGGPRNSMHSHLSMNGAETENKSKPGPGQYNGDRKYINTNIPAYSIGKGSRSDITKTNARGLVSAPVGNYDPDLIKTKNKEPNYKFSESKRKEVGQSGPAVGTYNIKSSIGDARSAAFHDKPVIVNK